MISTLVLEDPLTAASLLRNGTLLNLFISNAFIESPYDYFGGIVLSLVSGWRSKMRRDADGPILAAN